MQTLSIRPARIDDLPALIRLLADDEIGATRDPVETPLSSAYKAAFEAITRDARNLLIVAEQDDAVIGFLQMTYIQGLSWKGAERLLIEDLRVASAQRGQGIGGRLMAWCLDQARSRGCRVAELFAHQSRKEAHRFYKSFGFQDSHLGMRLVLESR